MEASGGDRSGASAGRVRSAVERDAARMSEIDHGTSPSPRSPDYHAASCRGRGGERVLVFDRDGEVLGFVVFSAVADEGSVHNIAVHPEQWGRGIGSALLDAALEDMRRQGLGCCLLEVRESSTAARALYASLGFLVDGRRGDYYRNDTGREDALLMSLSL